MKFIQDFDKIFAYFLILIFFCGGLLCLLIKRNEFAIIAFFFLLAPLIFLHTLNNPINLFNIPHFRNKKILYITNILFFFIFSISLLLLRQELYSRPPSFILVIALMSLLTIVEIFLMGKKIYIYIILLKSIIIGLLLRFSLFFQYPSVTSDAIYHQRFISLILQFFKTPDFGIYQWTPLMHIMSAQIDQICLLSIKSSISIIIFIVIIGNLFVYLIMRKFFGNEIALCGLLIVEFGAANIWFSTLYVGGMSYGIPLILMIVFILFSSLKQYQKSLLLILPLIGLILTHVFTTVLLIIIPGIIFCSEFLKEKFIKVKNNDITILSSYLLALIVISVLFYWLYSTLFIQNIIVPYAGDVELSNIMELKITGAAAGTSGSLQLWNLASVITLLFFSFIGILMCISNIIKKFNKNIFIFIAISSTLIIFIGISLVGQLESSFYYRWIVFIEIFSSSFCVIGMLITAHQITSKKNFLGFFSIVLIFCIINISNPFINFQNVTPWTQKRPVGMLTTSELKATEFTENIYNNNVYLDILIFRTLLFDAPTPYPVQRKNGGYNIIMDPIISGSQQDFSGFALIRESILDNGIMVRWPTFNVTKEKDGEIKMTNTQFLRISERQGYNVIFESGSSRIIYNA
jgi:hypothetical protein